MVRTCNTCSIEKPISEFRNGKNHRYRCYQCCLKVNRERYADYHNKHRDRVLERMKQRHDKQRELALETLGGRCVCCGETNPCFLTVDHVNGNGSKLRRTAGHNSIYKWLIRNKFPDGFQVLCNNCNHGRYRNGGICPHQEGSTVRAQARSSKWSEAPKVHLTHRWIMI